MNEVKKFCDYIFKTDVENKYSNEYVEKLIEMMREKDKNISLMRLEIERLKKLNQEYALTLKFINECLEKVDDNINKFCGDLGYDTVY